MELGITEPEDDEMRHPAYQLRTNKAVDRLLLVELVRRLGPEGFTYYTFGGPFLEDLRVMDNSFPEMKLVSLESNLQTYRRQNFNRFSSRLDLRNETMKDFLIHSFDAGEKDIFWLDYTDLKYENFQEFQSVLLKVSAGSLVRITLNAEPELDFESFSDKLGEEELARLKVKIKNNFLKKFDALLVPPVEDKTLESYSLFPALVQSMVALAAAKVMDRQGSKVEFLPLQTTRYNDGTQMLTVTGMVCQRGETEQVKNTLKGIRFQNFDWHIPDRLDVPALSIKERLRLEEWLPVSAGDKKAGELLYEKLEYHIDNGEKRTIDQLELYAACQRDYPSFTRFHG